MLECKDDSSSVREITEVQGITLVKIFTYGNCAGNFAASINPTGGKLDLRFWIKPTIIEKRNGELVEILEKADCECPFEFSYEIACAKNVVGEVILINGRTIRDINKYPREIEIEIDMDDDSLGPSKQDSVEVAKP